MRGFALMGLFLVHVVEQWEVFWAHPDYGPVFQWVFGVFAGKSYALLALCFGVSFFLIMLGAARRGEDYRRRFAWRLATLAIIGVIHTILYRGDILTVLALLGMAMLLFDRIKSNRMLIVISLLFFVQLPLLVRAAAASQGAEWALAPPLFYNDTSMAALQNGSFIDTVRGNFGNGHMVKWMFFIEHGRVAQILGLFAIGLVLGRVNFFGNPEGFKVQRRMALAAAGVASLLFHWIGLDALKFLTANEPARTQLYWAMESWKDLALLAFETLLFVELFQTVGRPLLGLLAAPGRMTLTLYVGQSVVFAPFFYGYGLGMWDELTAMQCLIIGLVAFPIQVLFAHLWFQRFHYGPLEWLWRAATRTSFDVPFVRRPALSPA